MDLPELAGTTVKSHAVYSNTLAVGVRIETQEPVFVYVWREKQKQQQRSSGLGTLVTCVYYNKEELLD